MVMPQQHMKPDDIAAPIDIRLVPGAALTVLICFVSPSLPHAHIRCLPWILVAVGTLTVVSCLGFRRIHRSRIAHGLLLASIACWSALPATVVVQQQRDAAQESGWLDFVEGLGTARMSVSLVTDPVERDGPFGSSWFVTADVLAYSNSLTPTPHPARIVISGDYAWAQFAAEDQACFIGKVTTDEASVFVQAVASVEPGDCRQKTVHPGLSGREVVRETLRHQSAQTISYAPELLPGLILGDRSQQSDEIDNAMKVSGLSHLSAVSGAHTSLIAGAATLVFRSLRLPRSVVIVAFLATLMLFVQIVGMQPSIIRAATMGALGAWAVFFGRGSQALPILALSTTILLTVSPELIHEVGFQLSVAATAGIVLAGQPLEAWIRPGFERFLPNFWASMLSSSLAISVTAQLACQPLLLTFIDYVSPYSLLANLLATPLLPFITIPGTLAAALCVIAPSLTQVLLHAVALPATVIGWVATTVTGLPGAALPWPEGPVGSILIVLHWATSAICLLHLLRHQRRSKPAVKMDAPHTIWAGIRQTVEDRVRVVHIVQCAIVTMAVIGHVVAFWPTRSTIDDRWDIIGCDVGQGDMFLLRTGSESAMVIDTGPDPELARQCLEAAKVTQVDLLVITHLHADHVGGLLGISEVAAPQLVIYSTGADPTSRTTATQLGTDAQRIQQPITGIIDHARQDPEHAVQLRWSVLSADSTATNENNASMVMFIEIYRHGGVTTALFTGDIEEDQTARLLTEDRIPQNVDILKLPHHGAKNGGTELLEHTSPSMALIGVGEDNSYGHPHPKIIETLEPTTTIRRTDIHKTFSVTLQHSPAYVALER